MGEKINMNSKIGYLSPTGELHECAPYGHLSFARDMIDDMVNAGLKVPAQAKVNTVEAERYLLSLGYIAIRSHDCYGHIGYYVEDNSGRRLHMTDEQKKWLLDNYGNFGAEKQKCVDRLFDWDM